MSWAGHDDAPHFQFPWAEHPRVKATFDTLATVANKNRRIVIIFLSAALLAGAITLGPKIRNSIIETFERDGRLTGLQGRAPADTTQPAANFATTV